MNAEQERTALKEEFPTVSIVHSDADRWWAFGEAQPGNPERIDVDANTPGELRARLRELRA